MPLTLADGRTRLVALETIPADPAALTAAVINAGVKLHDRILKSDFRLSPTASDTVADTPLSNEGNAVAFGASNYEGTVSPFRYLEADGTADPVNDVAWDLLKEKGSEMLLVKSQGKKASEAFATGDEYDAFLIITDNPQDPTDRGGYVKRIVPLGVQNAWLNKVVASGA